MLCGELLNGGTAVPCGLLGLWIPGCVRETSPRLLTSPYLPLLVELLASDYIEQRYIECQTNIEDMDLIRHNQMNSNCSTDLDLDLDNDDSAFLVASGKLTSRIYGGEKAYIQRHPSLVSVQIRNEHVCGGVMISDTHILTTASCVSAEKNIVYANIQIQSGSSTLFADNLDIFTEYHKVAYVMFHNNYNPRINWIHDIAILKLSSTIIFHDLRNLAVLPNKVTNGNSFYLIGWGVNPQSGIMTRQLQRLEVRSIASATCKYQYFERENFASTQFCLFPRSSRAQITLGNGGSPVQLSRKIIGIISIIDVNPQRPVVYTRVEKYVDWIQSMKQKY